MRFVPPNSSGQLALRAVHRIRQRLVSDRTRLVSRARGLLAGQGIATARDIRQRSSGGKARVLGISERGDRSIRTPMIPGARAVPARAHGKQDARSQWIGRMRERRHPNAVAIALADRKAGIVWSVLPRGDGREPAPSPPTA